MSVKCFLDTHLANIDKYCHASYTHIYIMSSTINLSLTDELRLFIDRNCGDQGLYSTPSEFVRDLLREKKMRQEAAALREGVLEGYRDQIEGRVIEYSGDLRATLSDAGTREHAGW